MTPTSTTHTVSLCSAPALRRLGKGYGKPVRSSSFHSLLDYMKSFRDEAGLRAVDWTALVKFLWLCVQKIALDKGEKTVGLVGVCLEPQMLNKL